MCIRDRRDTALQSAAADWESALAQEVNRLLVDSGGKVHEILTNSFERVLITRALAHTGGCLLYTSQGTVECETRPGQTCFTIRMPLITE